MKSLKVPRTPLTNYNSTNLSDCQFISKLNSSHSSYLISLNITHVKLLVTIKII